MARSSKRDLAASEQAGHIRRTPGATRKSAGAPPAVVPAVAVDLPALESELEQTRARLARIIGAADAGLASVRRRARLRRVVTLG